MIWSKPYKAKTLSGAQAEVRSLRRHLESCHKLVDKFAGENKELRAQLVEMAKLAADGACFDNPILVARVTKLRDEILRSIGLAPDGKFLPKEQAAQ